MTTPPDYSNRQHDLLDLIERHYENLAILAESLAQVRASSERLMETLRERHLLRDQRELSR